MRLVKSLSTLFTLLLLFPPALSAAERTVEVSDDGHESVIVTPSATDGQVIKLRDAVPYGAAPDWQNNLRRQVGGLQVADMNGDGFQDVVVGCYISSSYPPYTAWRNLIYFNTGVELETNPSWVSTDEVSTGDIQVAFINADEYPDLFSANGGSSMSPSVIYWGGPGGPSMSPGWVSAEPGLAWNNYALPFDIDHDRDTDVITANQGNSPTDPFRPMYIFLNNAGVLPAAPGWQSAEWSIQNFLAMADYDGNGWEDLAVSKWANFESGIYANVGGVIQGTPVWTTGDSDTDKGVAWADVDGDTWPDLALGHDPTELFGNDAGALSVVWTASASYFGHSEIRFCDVDRDGDEDLAETHFANGQVRVYLNDGGALESAPSWMYDSPYSGTAIAFGDINGDDWPDLVVGNSGDQSVEVFYANPPSTGVASGAPRPAAAVLHGASPNPFNPSTTICYEISKPGLVRLAVYSESGRWVSTLVDGVVPAGRHEAAWDGTDASGSAVASGVYFCRIDAVGVTESCRLTLVR